jgi:hypothetical protein
MRHTVHASKTPLYLQGYLGDAASKVVGASAAPAGAITTAAIASSAATGSAWGAWAGPIGAGVGVAIGLIAGLLAAHAMRVKQAKDENSAVNLGLSGFDSDLRTIQSDYSAGKVDAATAEQAVQVAYQNYWSLVTPHIQPARNGCSGGSSCPPDTSAQGKQPCKGNIGAACCVGCYQIYPTVYGPGGVLAAFAGQSTSSGGPYVADIHPVYGSKYGAKARAAFTLNFQSPAAASSSITSALESITGGSGSGSILPWLIAAGVGLAVFA